MRTIEFEVVCRDVRNVEADAVAIKYPQPLEQADRTIKGYDHSKGDESLRRQLGLPGNAKALPKEGEHRFKETPSKNAKSSLIIGVPNKGLFRYKDAKAFAHQALKTLKEKRPQTSHVCLRAPEEWLGMAPVEGFFAEVCGILSALDEHESHESQKENEAPDGLSKVTFATSDPEIARELRAAKEKLFPHNGVLSVQSKTMINNLDYAAKQIYEYYKLQDSKDKPFIFVAMPFDSSMYDHYYYPIRLAAEGEKLSCELVDTYPMAADIVKRMMERIAASEIVIADLSTNDPNVLFGLGYAFGKEIPIILIAEAGTKLPFHVGDASAIHYESMRNLHKQLAGRLKAMRGRKKQGLVQHADAPVLPDLA